MLIASILITGDDREAAEPPPLVRENITSFKAHHPGFEHRLFDLAAIRELLSRHYGAEVLRALDSLKPFAFKADLARYCILHHYGGVYADLSYRFVRGWQPDASRIAVFRDFMSSTPWDTCTSIIAAPPGHRALAKAIELALANVASRYYGTTPLCPTGPTLFGKALALTCGPEDLVMGQSRWFIPEVPGMPRPAKPVHCQFFNRELVAVKRKRGGGPMAELGLDTGNQYGKMWRDRDIYAAPGTLGRMLASLKRAARGEAG
jgi:hypothetical protein